MVFVTVIVLVIFVAVVCKMCLRHKVKLKELRIKEKLEEFNYSSDIFKHVEKRLDEELDKDPPRLDKIDRFESMVESILEMRNELVSGESSVSRMTSRSQSQGGYSRTTSNTYSRSSSASGAVCHQRSWSSREAYAMETLEEDITEEEEARPEQEIVVNMDQERGIIKVEGVPASNEIVVLKGGVICDDGGETEEQKKGLDINLIMFKTSYNGSLT